MAYNTMKKLIMNANARLRTGEWSWEEYDDYKETQSRKLDVFYAAGRLTDEQYTELISLWVEEE